MKLTLETRRASSGGFFVSFENLGLLASVDKGTTWKLFRKELLGHAYGLSAKEGLTFLATSRGVHALFP